MEKTQLTALKNDFFIRTIKDMPFSIIKQIAERSLVHIPIDLVGRPEEIAFYLVNNLNDKAKETAIAEYGDAGHALIYFFTAEMPTPTLESLAERGTSILSLNEKSSLLDNMPYFESVEVDSFTHTYRARFHYFKGNVFLLDKDTKVIRQERRAFYGVVVFRPRKKLIEVRAKHQDVARIAAIKTATMVGINQSVNTLNFRKQEFIKSFLGWIRSLNNARIELSTRGALSSITMSSREGADLRNVKDFQKYLEAGMLRGGHATIIEEKEIKFRIFFRDCHVYFTSFSSETDVELVSEVLEKITGGFIFNSPERLIDEFFK